MVVTIKSKKLSAQMGTMNKTMSAKILMNANRIYTIVIGLNPVSISLDHMIVNVKPVTN